MSKFLLSHGNAAGAALAVCLCSLLLTPQLAAAAQTQAQTQKGGALAGLPAAVAKASAEIRKVCRDAGGKPRGTGIAHAVDLTGDGFTDYVLFDTAVECDGAASAMSGGQLTGAEFQIFVGGPGGTARKLLRGEAFGTRVDASQQPAQLLIEVAGRACGQHNADDLPVAGVVHCERALAWYAKSGKFVWRPPQALEQNPAAAADLSAQPGIRGASPQGAASRAVSPAAALASPAADACAGRSMCYDGRGFMAQLLRAQLVVCRNRGDGTALLATVRLSNQSEHTMLLGYQMGSIHVIDNLGATWRTPSSCGEAEATGIAAVINGQVQRDFELAPGQSRDVRLATWVQIPLQQAHGTVFDIDFGLEEYRVEGRQLERVRQHRPSFAGVSGAGAPLAGLRGAGKAEDKARKLKGALEALKSLGQ